MPPWRAIAIAKRESVTVSIAAATIGMLRGILRVKQVRVSASVGNTDDLPGSKSTSSNVKPSGMAPSIINHSPEKFGDFLAGEMPINNLAQPDSLGSNAIQLSQNTLIIKMTILGTLRCEIKERTIAPGCIFSRAPYHYCRERFCSIAMASQSPRDDARRRVLAAGISTVTCEHSASV